MAYWLNRIWEHPECLNAFPENGIQAHTHTHTQLVQLTQCNFNVLNKPCPGCAAAHTGIVNFIELIHILGNCNDNTHSKLSQQFLIYYSQTTYYHSRTLFPFFRRISHDDDLVTYILVYVRILLCALAYACKQRHTRALKYQLSIMSACNGMIYANVCNWIRIFALSHFTNNVCFNCAPIVAHYPVGCVWWRYSLERKFTTTLWCVKVLFIKNWWRSTACTATTVIPMMFWVTMIGKQTTRHLRVFVLPSFSFSNLYSIISSFSLTTLIR